MRFPRASLVLVSLAGCSNGGAPADLAQPARPPAAATAPAPVAPVDAGAPTVVTAPMPAKAEVEMSGAVHRPKGAAGAVDVFITDGECWKPGVRAVGKNTTPAGGDRWGIEVLVPQGSKLWVCAALPPAPGKKITVYGQAPGAPFLGAGRGEVIFTEVPIPLKAGPPVTPPPVKP